MINTQINFFNLIKILLFTITFNFIIFWCLDFHFILLNDYLNPFTITFKNPKTLQMFNIMILYHYIMAFLVGVIVATFILIFLAPFRTYFFFNYKTFFKPVKEFGSFSEFLAYFKTSLYNLEFVGAYEYLASYIRFSIMKQKNKYLSFYKNDIKSSVTDQVTHAPLLEFLWVIFPALILVAIAYPSILLLYYNEAYIEPIFNITVIGNQWFWTYEYNDFNLVRLFKNHIHSDSNSYKKYDVLFAKLSNLEATSNKDIWSLHSKNIKKIISEIPRRITVDCNMIIAKDPRLLRLLTTDQCLVIPAKTPIRLLITSADVIHSWAVPSYGIKVDAVPGRINQQILVVPLMGTSWGQCSELCGVNHAFMPIEVKVLALSDFMYYMQLRVKEILLPYFEAYYSYKINFIKEHFKFAQQLVDQWYETWFTGISTKCTTKLNSWTLAYFENSEITKIMLSKNYLFGFAHLKGNTAFLDNLNIESEKIKQITKLHYIYTDLYESGDYKIARKQANVHVRKLCKMGFFDDFKKAQRNLRVFEMSLLEQRKFRETESIENRMCRNLTDDQVRRLLQWSPKKNILENLIISRKIRY